MHFICRLNLDIMRPETLAVAEVNRAIEGLQQFDGVYQRGQPYLRAWENCTTIQQHLEHLALRMHSSFFIAVLCRPAIKTLLAQPPLPHTDILRTRAKASLIDASKAFLDFQALSVIPLRTWSMVHTVLSSTLLLCAWEETRNDPECRGLQQRVIDVFSLSDSTAGDGALLSDNNREWLSARHIRALVKLRNALDREEGISTTGNENWAGLGANAISPLGTVCVFFVVCLFVSQVVLIFYVDLMDIWICWILRPYRPSPISTQSLMVCFIFLCYIVTKPKLTLCHSFSL